MSMPAENLGNHGTLDALLQDIADAPAIDIAGISSDSRKLGPGFLFLAIQGATSHGLEFLAQAEAAGAAAVAYDASTGSGGVESEIPLIPVEGLAHRLGEIANRWYGFPSHDVHVTGVTGTNGKTTVAYLAAQCLTGLGSTCGYIGTLGSGIDDISGEGAMTTPVCIDLHELLAGFRSEGARHAAIEVSSHALEQARVDGVRFDSAIFTNLSRDHIDYHGSMDAYFESKASLFLDHDVRNRIVSLDTEYGVELAERCGANVVTVSSHLDRVANGRPHVFVRSVVAAEAGSNIGIRSSWGEAEIQLPLPGDFNVANAMEVLALLLCNDISLEDACAALEEVKAPPGRMERVNRDIDDDLPMVYVDYSHTPASIEAALKALRLHCRGELWCVFGCGGDRDRGKRPMMGKVAERLSDHAIVTSDNPRTEPPAQIIADILEGMGEGSRAIVDRAEAIAFAINGAAADDVILIAGKGHENYQVIGEQTLSFSDFDAAVDCLSERGAARK
jgi:UDP-N-acetylmuramoyl-L-alanyl-D-glutamate--2,6-diaminopimelate ligase